MVRQFDDFMLGSIELFCLAAEEESFTRAARRAGLTPAAVSRSVTRLEARLGARLFARTTRRIRLSDAGREYFQHCRSALNQLIDAERQISGQQQHPAGTLRISVPTAFGHYRVLPLLPAFHARYPEVCIDVHLSNRNIDFTADACDLAIRGRAPPDSGLVARKLEDADLVVVAAPAYLARCGVPITLEDLAHHDCVQFVLPSSGQDVTWLFRNKNAEVELVTNGTYRCSDDVLGVVTLARTGAGLSQTYRFIVAADLASGALVEVLRDNAGRSRPFSLIHPGGRHLPSRVRAFIDFLLAELRSPQAADAAARYSDPSDTAAEVTLRRT